MLLFNRTDMQRLILLLVTFLIGIAACHRTDIDPAILGPEVNVEESLRPITISSKIMDGQLRVDIVPHGPVVCCCAPCPQSSYINTAKYEVQIAFAELGPYRPYTTIKVGKQEDEQLETRSLTLPNSLTTQPVVVRVVAISKSGRAGYVRAIMNSTSPIPASITELIVSEKDELSSLNVNPVRPQVAYVTYEQDAAFNVIPTLYLADYTQGKLLNPRVLTPGGFSPTFSRDGRQLAYFLPRQTTSSFLSLFIRDITTDSSRVIQFPGDLWLGSPTWSPDGRWIAFLEQNNEHTRLWKLNVTDGKLEAITPAMPYKGPGGVWQGFIDWSPDGKTIAVSRSLHVTDTDWRVSLSMVSPTNGTFLSDINTLAGWGDKNPSYSPDGRSVAFVSSRANTLTNYTTIWIRNLTTNQLRHLRLPDSYQLSDVSLPRWVSDNALLITAYTGNPVKPRNLIVSL